MKLLLKLTAGVWGSFIFVRISSTMATSEDSSKPVSPSESDGSVATGSSVEELTKSKKENGLYVNPWSTWKDIKMKNAVKFFLVEKDNSGIPGKQELDKTLPIVKPKFDDFATSPQSGVRTMWVGHASVLVQFDNITILTDPIFSDRCAPTQYFGPKRFRKPPCKIEDLPKIDAVVISHNHYDHLDYYSVVGLNKKFGDNLRWYVPMGLKEWMTSTGVNNVVEMDWWEEKEHVSDEPLDGMGVTFVCTPCQHWSKRTAFDDCKTLWSSWAVIGPIHSFYFGGDTGYCEVFKQIGRKYGPFTLAAIPIGAYEPRWFMHPQHVNPEESVHIHEDIQARISLGIHWGTFKLTNEPYLEPEKLLKEELQKRKLDPAEFITIHHGKIEVLGGDGYDKVD